MDTLVLSTAWFETERGWRSFHDPAIVRIPIAESEVRLAERRVSPGRTLLAVGVGVPVVAWILLMVLYLTTYSAAT